MFPAILNSSYIQQQKAELAQLQQQQAQLSEKFGEKHPEIVKTRSAIQNAQLKLQMEINKVVQAVRTEFQAAQAQEMSLAVALGQQKGEAMAMNRKGIEYSVLERDMQSSKQLYENLMQRAKETSVSSELKNSNIRVIDRAERPRQAVSPRKALNLMLGLLSGTVLALGLTFFFEYLDSRLKTPDEVRVHLGLPALGMVPALDAKSWTGKEPLIHAGVPPGFAEAFRTIRTNVLFSTADEGSRTLVVTSTGPGEGKTTVASNLAIAFAHAGQRVLLIDGDMRRPRVHEVFGLRQEPGLSNVMVGNAKASQSVHKTTVPGLWVLAAGHLPPNPAELLGSQRFRDFVALAQGALRPDPDRFAAGDGGDRRGDRRARRQRGGVRGRRRDDQPARGARRGRAAGAGPRPLRRRHPEPGRPGAELLLLLELLPPRVRRVLPAGRQREVAVPAATSARPDL